MQKHIKLWSNIMLIGTAVIWGSQVVFQKIAAQRIGAASFLGARYIMGVLTMLIIAYFMAQHEKHRAMQTGEKLPVRGRSYYKRLFMIAPLCVLSNLSGNLLFQIGLAYVPASKAAFLNAIYIVFTPILSWIVYRNRTSIFTWLGTLLAVVGLYYLCMTEALTVAWADLIILASTIFYALHIVLIAKYVHEFVGIHFSIVEFTAAAIICLVIGIIFEGLTLDQITSVIPSILFCGIGGIGICYALQVTAQKYTDPTIAALLMSLEAVFAAIAGYIFLNERFTGREILGIVLISLAVILAQLPPISVIREKLAGKH